MTWARNAVAHALVLRSQDPSWGTEVFELAGGHVVLGGPGLYVNRALGLGLARPVTDADFEVLEERSATVGVPSSVDVVPTADRSLTERAGARGYAILRFLTTHVRPVADTSGRHLGRPDDRDRAGRRRGASRGVAGRRRRGIRVGDGLGRRASDAFAAAAAVVDGRGFLLARDAADGRPLGCASVTIRDGLATLGAMATRPSERRTRRAGGAHRPPAADRRRSRLRPRRVIDDPGQHVGAQPAARRVPPALRDRHAGQGTSGDRK